MNAVRTLAKNTTVLLVANIISYLLGFFTTLYTARYLGVEGFGVLSLALSLTGIFGVFTDLGLTTLTTREVSRDESLASKYIGNTAIIKIIYAFLTFGLISLIVYIIGYPQEVKTVVYIITLSVILTAFTGIFNSIFQAFQKMEYMSLNIVINAILMITGILIVIHFGLGIIALSSVYLISSAIVLVVTLITYSWKFFVPKIGLDLKFWIPTIKEASFFGVSNILVVIYFYIDSLMLSIMVGYSAVGIYNASYKLIVVLLFIPGIFITSIFPLMSQHFESSKTLLKLEYEKSVKYLFATAVFIFIVGFSFADKIILIIYGTAYTPSILALQILIFVMPIIFITNLFGNLLGAINRQRILIIITAVSALFNVALNLILIQKFSYIGASIATVITEGLVFILMFLYISKHFLRISLNKNISKTIIAGILTSLLIFYLKMNINWFLAAVLGVLIYILMLFVLKIITKEDVDIFRQIF